MHAASLSENDEGELTRAEGEDMPGRITEARITGNKAVITIADAANPSAAAIFDFKLTGPNEAGMNPEHHSENKIVTKPWKMTRISPNP